MTSDNDEDLEIVHPGYAHFVNLHQIRADIPHFKFDTYIYLWVNFVYIRAPQCGKRKPFGARSHCNADEDTRGVIVNLVQL